MPRSPRARLAVAAALPLVALAMPWLNPVAGGPSPSVQPWLVSAGCIALVALLARSSLPRAAVALPLFALAAIALLRSGSSLDTLALAGGILVIALAAGAAERRERLAPATVANAWLAAALIGTGIALLQAFGSVEWLEPLASASSQAEAYGNLRQRNQFASLCAIGLAAVLWHPRPVPPWLAAAAVVALAVGNAATTSRTGLLELLALAVLAGVWSSPARPRTLRLALLALGAYVIAAPLLPWLQAQAGIGAHASLWDRVAGVSSCSSRAVLWSNVLQLIAERPWLGWGWGELDYAHYATLYPDARFCDILDNAHSLPLHLAAELGLPAVLLALAAVVSALLRTRPGGERDPGRQMAWAVLTVLALHSLLEYPLWYGPFQIALGLSLGLLAPQSDAAATPRRLVAAVPLLFGAVLAYAAWDYHRVSQIYLAPQRRDAAYREDTVGHIRRSWLFAGQARFAELTLTPLTLANAPWTFATAQAVLHYSPEPKVVEKAIESAVLLRRDDEALWHLVRFRAAFPEAHAEWALRGRAP